MSVEIFFKYFENEYEILNASLILYYLVYDSFNQTFNSIFKNLTA